MAKAVRSKSKNTKNGRKKNASEYVFLKLRRDELELLKAKIHEVATEIARSQKRIAKTWNEIERIKAETRKKLARLNAT